VATPKKPVSKKPVAEKLITEKTAPKKTVARKPAAKKKAAGSGNTWKILVAGLVIILLSPFYYGYVLKMFSSTWQWFMDTGENPHYRVYKSFNIRIPNKYQVHGIDVSYAQGKINWPKVKAMEEDSVHVSFAFIKASEGLLKVDPYFKRNWREAPKVGITCGPYHFFRSNKNGMWQARFFLQNFTLEAGDLPPVVDIETLDGAKPEAMRKELQAFLTYVEAHTRVKPLMYTTLSFYADYLAGYFDNYHLWIAHYNQDDLKVGPSNWLFWQHSDKASINGIYHTVDFDAFKGDSLAFTKLLVQ
jgi:lysozyme